MKLIVVGLILINLVSVSTGQSRKNSDDKLYDDLRSIEGQIEILNHPSLGRTPGNNIWIIFQRVDCKKCFFSVQADLEGKYYIPVSKGKYRIIYRSPTVTNGKYYDWLSPDQPRIVDVSGKQRRVNFDIKILMPND